MKRLLLLLLLTPCLVMAAATTYVADVRIVKDAEYGTNLTGIISRGVLSSFHIWEQNYSPYLASIGMMEPTLGTNAPIRRLMGYHLNLVNVGNNWAYFGNPFANPENFIYIPGYRAPHLVGIVGVAIAATNGPVVREQVGVTSLAWDSYQSLPRLEKGPFSWFAPGMSAGYASQSTTAVFDGTFIDVTGLTNGTYNFVITVDPLNTWGQFAAHKTIAVAFNLNGFDARLCVPDPPPPPEPVVRPERPPGIPAPTNAPPIPTP